MTLHIVQYYETDMMGITLHANYIRWMEETRIDFMDQLGFPYSKMEQEGVLSPVRSLSIDYKHLSTFGDRVSIMVSVESFNGVVIALIYEMRNQSGGNHMHRPVRTRFPGQGRPVCACEARYAGVPRGDRQGS